MSGNQATFTFKLQEPSSDVPFQEMHVGVNLDAQGKIVKIHFKDNSLSIIKDFDVKTNAPAPNPGDVEYHNHLIRYFNEKVGYPADQGVISESGVPAVEEKNPVNKVNDAAKNAMGKVKGLLKKKKFFRFCSHAQSDDFQIWKAGNGIWSENISFLCD